MQRNHRFFDSDTAKLLVQIVKGSGIILLVGIGAYALLFTLMYLM